MVEFRMPAELTRLEDRAAGWDDLGGCRLPTPPQSIPDRPQRVSRMTGRLRLDCDVSHCVKGEAENAPSASGCVSN